MKPKFYVIEKVYSNVKQAESTLKKIKDKVRNPYVTEFNGNVVLVLYETESHDRAVEAVHHYFSKGIECAIHRGN